MPTITIHHIQPQESPRPLDEGAVAMLAQSMQAIGLIQPITVRKVSVHGGTSHAWRLVSGAHRVEAARRIGWTEIDARILDDGLAYLETELIEIDENLCRAELSPAQRAAAIRRRKEVWEALHPGGIAVEQFVPPQSPMSRQQHQRFAAETAVATGQSKQDINRHLSRADALGDDLTAVAGTSLDKGVELDALKTLPEAERKDLIARAQAGEPVSARKPMARISLTIEYLDQTEGAELIADTILKKDPALAAALYRRLGHLLKEAA